MRQAIREDKTNLDKKDAALLRKFVDVKKDSFSVVDIALCDRVPFLRDIESELPDGWRDDGARGGASVPLIGNVPASPANRSRSRGGNGSGSRSKQRSGGKKRGTSPMNMNNGSYFSVGTPGMSPGRFNNMSNNLNESSLFTNSMFQDGATRVDNMLDSDMGGIGASSFHQPSSILLENSCFLRGLKEINRIDDNIASLQECLDSPKKAKARDKNAKLVQAMGFFDGANNILDCSRYYFEAAIIFDDIRMYDRSIDCFKRSTVFYPAETIVAEYDQPFTELVRRKIERMSKHNLQGWYQQREADKVRFIASEKERQRLRAVVSWCQLVRLYFVIEDAKSAHDALCKAFRLCNSSAERNEIMWYLHATIKQYNDNGVGDYPKAYQILYEQRSVISEAHLKILHELEKLTGGDSCEDLDILHWIAYRYSEKTDFALSKKYFLRIRGLLEPPLEDNELLKKYLIRPRGLNEDELKEVLNKHITREFASDEEVDKKLQEARDDWIGFYSKHHGIHVRYYEAPGQGWEEGARGQQRLLELKQQDLKLPDIVDSNV